MKKINLIIVAIVAIVIYSCNNKNEEFNAPTFKVTSFERIYINGTYNCKASIVITDIPKAYSIDGLLYADTITLIDIDIPKYEYDIQLLDKRKLYFNVYGKHKGNIKIKIAWTSKEDRKKYLVGWHLTYGYGKNCSILMIDLDQK